ncbi:MAG: metal-dependent hydrolase [Akkermansiaceae bacterium]|jgi:membrane-bound metal-dependent hydrolase YbcI (DUF457 family)|nr:metal-dependent hydrolase [Akkermansiaceae bacterium]MDP4846590.1 metal-dependent hydrolase [Akkermansiaceae bacterium]MDP4898383.1 metal-dependent hydrolase [Akkermansiaceae bacterium]MDP4995345.1 metal-dependent hydrolase [Akkermansiaceae bacterium]
MNIFTHALSPVIITHLCMPASKKLPRRSLIAIGVAGALPDLLNPHLYLEARMTSWSHALPFWTCLTIVLLLASLFSKKRLPLGLSIILSAAYLFHLICDAISGGINWLYPCSNYIWGTYWVSPLYWVPLDLLCILTCYYLFRLRPLLKRRASQAPPIDF